MLILPAVGGVLGRSSALALLFALAPALAVPAHAAGPRVVDTSQRAVLRTGVLRVQVVAQRSGRIRLVARRGRAVIGQRRVRFARPGARTVGLRLTERGRAAVERCRSAS